MKIAYYLPSLIAPGGLERVITFKANYFASIGHDVTIITSEQAGQPEHFELSPRVKRIDLNVLFDYPFDQPFLLKLIKYPVRYYLFKKRFKRALLATRPDITISTLRREINFLPYMNDGSVKIGEFHVTRNSYGMASTNALKRFIKERWQKGFIKNLSAFSRIVLLTHEEQELWPELKNTVVIPNPILTRPGEQSDTKAKIVIAAGRYAEQKGFDLLIKAWKVVFRKHPDWQLHIYGDGGLRESLQKQIDDAGMTKVCILKHNTPNIEQKYSASSIYALSSRFEGFGMVLIEAMSCGLPLVSFDCACGPKDIITPGEDGILVKSFDTDSMGEAINSLIEDDEKRELMGENSYRNSNRYKMEQISKIWNTLFCDVTSEKKK
jgi:glycosyltransferase involved in cell wall biosynthesis